MISQQAFAEDQTECVPSESVVEVQQRLIEEFELFEDWSDRYQTLIEFGQRLGPMPDALKTERNRIHNCHGDCWLAGETCGGVLRLSAASDTGVAAGLLAVIVEIYSGRPSIDVLDHPLMVLDAVGLTDHLSPHRRAALHEIVGRLRELARAAGADRFHIP